MSDIVERLRDATPWDARPGSREFRDAAIREAADEIERLRAEVARLRDVLDGVEAFLTNPRIGTVNYMEGADFYIDLGEVAKAVCALTPHDPS